MKCKSRYSSFDNALMECGRGPDIKFCCRDKYCKFNKRPMALGIDDVSEFVEKSICATDVR